MLAYVFWHQRVRQVTREEYQEKLSAFHRVLQKRQPRGFVGSLVLAMPALPWMNGESEVYEDWYLVENSAALDPLDEAAVSGMCQEAHNQVARLANSGTGGLYRLKDALNDLARWQEIRSATWFGKPAGMSYTTLYASLEQGRLPRQGVLWQRQMTMGPALEFCLHNFQPPSLASELESLTVEAQPIFVPGK